MVGGRWWYLVAFKAYSIYEMAIYVRRSRGRLFLMLSLFFYLFVANCVVVIYSSIYNSTL